MSAPENESGEFELLLAAFANRDLTAAEDLRLGELAAGEAGRMTAVRELRAVHGAFERERRLRAELAAPSEPREEACEGFRRLNRVAAAAEAELRARLQHPARPLHAAPGRRRRPRLLLASIPLAAAAALVAVLAWGGAGRDPALLPNDPSGSTLGGPVPRIVLDAELRRGAPSLTWHAVLGASRYDAVIEDEDGGILLSRPDERARSNVWQLTSEQFEDLDRRVRSTGRALRLRIVARDGSGTVVASSTDLPLRLVD